MCDYSTYPENLSYIVRFFAEKIENMCGGEGEGERGEYIRGFQAIYDAFRSCLRDSSGKFGKV